MKVLVEKVGQKSDQRGSVWEPLNETELGGQHNCHVVTTNPGGIRGNHFHKLGTEIAAQGGPALVMFRDADGEHSVEIGEGEIVRFVIPPNCPHAFQNNGHRPNLLVASNTGAFNPDSPDVYPEPLIRA
jgi:dTDP-4-dehydrorhamnose 3,5-epimerase-like enzyme